MALTKLTQVEIKYIMKRIDEEELAATQGIGNNEKYEAEQRLAALKILQDLPMFDDVRSICMRGVQLKEQGYRGTGGVDIGSSPYTDAELAPYISEMSTRFKRMTALIDKELEERSVVYTALSKKILHICKEARDRVMLGEWTYKDAENFVAELQSVMDNDKATLMSAITPWDQRK